VSEAKEISVLFIIARMNVGGPAILITNLVRGLNSAGYKTSLVTGYCDDYESDYLDEVAPDIEAIRLPGFGRSISPLNDIKAFFLLLGEIRRIKPDIIHTHTAKAGVLGRIAGLIARPSATRIHTFHGHLLQGYFDSRKVKRIVTLEKILGFITFKFVAIGNQVKYDLVKAGIGSGNKFEVIYPGLHELGHHDGAIAGNSLNLAPGMKIIVFIGRLTRVKRPDRLIALARWLKTHHPNAHILLAGDGELYGELTLTAQRETLPMTFLGWRNDIGLILSASDIAVLCSDNEGIPLTLIQASQAGLPIVSTNVGSVCDIVVDGITGILTEVTSDGLIQGVSMLLADPEMGKRLGKCGEERAKEFFSCASMLDQHKLMYSQSIQ
jgi:glycosyltransferase involved in cell wall biosynthesis